MSANKAYKFLQEIYSYEMHVKETYGFRYECACVDVCVYVCV